MREVKFRCWDKNKKEMRFDNFVKSGDEDNDWIVFRNFKKDNPGEIVFDTPFIRPQFVIMQFTGMRDSTKWEDLSDKEQQEWIASGHTQKEWQGREIYEGDIVQFLTHDAKGEVIYKAPRFVVKDRVDELHSLQGYECEIIGNIHEHSRLLEAEARP